MVLSKTFDSIGRILKGLYFSFRSFLPFLCKCVTSVDFKQAATIHKIFETNSSFQVKWGTTGKVQFLFFRRFLLVLTNFDFGSGTKH